MAAAVTLQTVPKPPADPFTAGRLRLVLGTIALALAWLAVVAGRPWSDGRTAAGLALAQSILFAAYAVRAKDGQFARLCFGFGLTLGAAELAADGLCVHFTHTLDYAPARSLMLGWSPWWMPIAWMVVSTQIGFVGTRLMARLGTARGVLLTAVLGAVNIPVYEEMAYGAHWWRYSHCRMAGWPGAPLSHTPLYIIMAELVIGACLAPLARMALGSKTWGAAVGAGLLGGVATILGGLAGYGLMERIL